MLGESNYFSNPRFDSVIDRYFTRLYKVIRPSYISKMLNIQTDAQHIKQEQLKEKDSAVHDQYYFVHSNKLVLFGLSERHEAIVNNSTNPIVSVSFDSGKKHRSDNKVSGKSKSKGIFVHDLSLRWWYSYGPPNNHM